LKMNNPESMSSFEQVDPAVTLNNGELTDVVEFLDNRLTQTQGVVLSVALIMSVDLMYRIYKSRKHDA
jgi:hypothetical protein